MIKRIFILSFLTILINSCADKKSAVENFNAGLESYNDKDYGSALELFTLSIQKDNSNTAAFLFKGMTEVELNKHQDALVSFQKALNMDSSNFQAYIERAKLKIKLGDYVSAINDCEAGRIQKEDYSELYKVKGDAYEHLADITNAIYCYELAINYENNDGESYYKLGLLLMNDGKISDACENLRKAGDLGFMKAFDIIKQRCNSSSPPTIVTTLPLKDGTKLHDKSNCLDYSTIRICFPNGWSLMDKILRGNNQAVYGATNFSGGLAETFTVTEFPNELGFNSASQIDESGMRELIRALVCKLPQNEIYENRKLGKMDAKYCKLVCIAKKYTMTSENYIVLSSDRVYLISAISDSPDFENSISKKTFLNIFSSISFN